MANQLKMAEIQTILLLHRRGWSLRRIARELGINRETVGRYVLQARGVDAQAAGGTIPAGAVGGVDDGVGSAGPLSSLEQSKPAKAPTGSPAAFGGAGAAVAVPGSDDPAGQRSHAWPWRDVIRQKLESGLSAQRIYQDLSDPESEHGYAGSYYSVRRLAEKLTERLERPFRRIECEPGTEAEVDFGRGAPLLGADGKRKTSWVFRIILSHSRKGYSEAVARQGTDEFIRCLENALHHFGGCPRTLKIDNLKAAVTRADWFDPELCPKVRSFAAHYDTVFLPTRPYMPRHKGKVENGVKYVKNNALKGRVFASLAEQNEHLLQWETGVADRRIHGTTRRQVSALFEGEKPSLLPLPPSRFELFSEALRSVSRDGHVQVKGAYYSAPPEYMGTQVWARWDGRVVRLFNQRMELIAVHAQKAPGQFATLDAHILPEKISGIERGSTWLLRRISYIGPQAQAWAESMLQNRGIEGVRVLLGLLSLRRKHSTREIERACRIASGHESWQLRSLRLLIERGQPAIEQSHFEFASEHPIIRPVADYGQWVRSALSGGPSTADRALPAAQEYVP